MEYGQKERENMSVSCLDYFTLGGIKKVYIINTEDELRAFLVPHWIDKLKKGKKRYGYYCNFGTIEIILHNGSFVNEHI